MIFKYILFKYKFYKTDGTKGWKKLLVINSHSLNVLVVQGKQILKNSKKKLWTTYARWPIPESLKVFLLPSRHLILFMYLKQDFKH